jgi:heme-degrading monooxygenase HmoA
MIARLWRGRTAADDASEYLEYVLGTGVRDLSAADGNRGVLLLQRPDGPETELLILSLWDSMDSVRTFAGPRAELPVYYARDARYLLELEPRVAHYEVAVPVGVRTACEPVDGGSTESEGTERPLARSWMQYLVALR